MSLKKVLISALSILCLFYLNCSRKEPSLSNRVIIGISSDVDTFNPLYAYNINEGNITELLYLSLIDHSWNSVTGEVDTKPMLADEWEWNNDSTSLIITVRDDVKWSDGKKCTVDDIIFSFDLYSDPDVQSKLLGTFKNFFTNQERRIDIQKTFEIISPNRLKINFKPDSAPNLFDIDLLILPKHIFNSIPRKDLPASELNFTPVTNGPFKLRNWSRNQAIILESNSASFLFKDGNIEEIIFKIIPDYTSRINQLKTKEIDLAEDISAEDIHELAKYEHLTIKPVKGREYDYIGWSNVDQNIFQNDKKLAPHYLFGNPSIRRALTHAINRKEILEIYLNNQGMLCDGPVSPIFKSSIDSHIQHYEYNPEKAIELLKNDGWIDIDHDGVLEKGDREFSFKLFIPAGNPRRMFAAEIIKNNLKSIGIEVGIESTEMGMFIENLTSGKYDAWMAGWVIPIPIEMKQVWYSDTDEGHLNFVKYKNTEVDNLILQLEKKKKAEDQNAIYKKLQSLIHNDEPYSFLYWVDNLVCYNSKIEGIDINPLGVINHCWEWKIKK